MNFKNVSSEDLIKEVARRLATDMVQANIIRYNQDRVCHEINGVTLDEYMAETQTVDCSGCRLAKKMRKTVEKQYRKALASN